VAEAVPACAKYCYYRLALAAEKGHALAQLSLGACYQQVEGVPQDLAESVRYYRLAAAQEGALSPELIARSVAACDQIAFSREVASACCMVCGARRKLKKCAKCQVARFCNAECVARASPGCGCRFIVD
jgi:hypothetical protein